MAIIKLTKDNFEQEVLKSEKPVLVDFYADWCGPCQMLSPIVDEVAEERDDIKVGKINVDEQMELAQKYGVMTIPTLLVIKNGEITEKKDLHLPKQVVNVIRCKNPRCITSIEQELDQVFILADKEKEIYRCKYCEEKYRGSRNK